MTERELTFDDVIDADAQCCLDLGPDEEPTPRCQLCLTEGELWCSEIAECYYRARRRLGIPIRACRALLGRDREIYGTSPPATASAQTPARPRRAPL